MGVDRRKDFVYRECIITPIKGRLWKVHFKYSTILATTKSDARKRVDWYLSQVVGNRSGRGTWKPNSVADTFGL